MGRGKWFCDITYRRDGADLGDLGHGAAREVGHEVLLELLVARRRVRHGVWSTASAERRQQGKGVRGKKRSVGVIQSNTSLQWLSWGGELSSTVTSSCQFKVGQRSASHWPGWRFPGPHVAVAAESSAFSGGVGRFTNHRQPQMPGQVHQKAWPFKRRGLCQLLAATAFRNLRQPSSASRPSSSRLIIERHRRITLRMASYRMKISSFP